MNRYKKKSRPFYRRTVAEIVFYHHFTLTHADFFVITAGFATVEIHIVADYVVKLCSVFVEDLGKGLIQYV
ncbi:MAG: hypothetical protein CVU43_07085 [Chloroflexi bacterium HGW-Chloroflexi-5]|jgi:hypothetical protein|nr:MAG: hypothetical protein CVU43_07085 [Chloroflexi bacterium HGW-Chloroflexi-5]